MATAATVTPIATMTTAISTLATVAAAAVASPAITSVTAPAVPSVAASATVPSFATVPSSVAATATASASTASASSVASVATTTVAAAVGHCRKKLPSATTTIYPPQRNKGQLERRGKCIGGEHMRYYSLLVIVVGHHFGLPSLKNEREVFLDQGGWFGVVVFLLGHGKGEGAEVGGQEKGGDEELVHCEESLVCK
ncbi:hypothetical protein PG988_008015 [Apiospora saccharicola]